jgi:hypothetical protein
VATRVFVTRPQCGTCYRPAVATVYRRSPLRRALGLRATARQSCLPCIERHYKRPSRWRRGG